MRSTWNGSLTVTIFVLVSCAFGGTARGADAENEATWLANLINANNGKTFCAPTTTTLGEFARVLSRYSKAHPELHGQFTDQQTIRVLAETYPCKGAPGADLGNTDSSKLGGRAIGVKPKGEFSTIDTRPSIAIVQQLHRTAAHENDGLIGQIRENPGNYMPPVLFALSEVLYKQGNIDGAMFWFNAARLRGNLDAMICTDVTARSAVPAIMQQVPRDLIKMQFDSIPRLKGIVDRVLKWDEVTPYNYDRRWISLHGMRAINSGMGAADSGAPLTEPRESWGALAQKNRDQYRASFEQAIATLQERGVPK